MMMMMMMIIIIIIIIIITDIFINVIVETLNYANVMSRND